MIFVNNIKIMLYIYLLKWIVVNIITCNIIDSSDEYFVKIHKENKENNIAYYNCITLFRSNLQLH